MITSSRPARTSWGDSVKERREERKRRESREAEAVAQEQRTNFCSLCSHLHMHTVAHMDPPHPQIKNECNKNS